MKFMDCCSSKNEKKGEEESELVECEMCRIKTAKSVAAVMYLKGEAFYFCSHECQDRWEVKHPHDLW